MMQIILIHFKQFLFGKLYLKQKNFKNRNNKQVIKTIIETLIYYGLYFVKQYSSQQTYLGAYQLIYILQSIINSKLNKTSKQSKMNSQFFQISQVWIMFPSSQIYPTYQIYVSQQGIQGRPVLESQVNQTEKQKNIYKHQQNILQQHKTSEIIKRTINISKKENNFKQSQYKNLKNRSLNRKQQQNKQVTFKNQKSNRNVVSNILRTFFQKLNNDIILQQEIQNLINRTNLQTTFRRFKQFIIASNINNKKYMSAKRVVELFRGEQCEKKLLRILLRRFEKEECILHSLTSRKLSFQSARNHLAGIRVLNSKIY